MKSKLIVNFFLILFSAHSFAMENTFYILHSKHPEQSAFMQRANNSLQQHAKSIQLLISQAYHLNSKGELKGFLDANTLTFTREHHIKEMAMITNSGFDRDTAHQFLQNPAAQAKALQAILAMCKQEQVAGVQFDFEGIALADKSALTNFYVTAANALHKQGLLVSFAVVPADENYSAFLKRKYENWSGAYDLAALSKVADFISIMTYDQHNEGATPGPTASIVWVDSAIRQALKYVPANKLSLGVPVYSNHWYTGSHSDKPNARIGVQLDNLSYHQVQSLLKHHHLNLHWDHNHQLNYVMYQRNWLYEYLFVEDANSFKAKRALAKKYRLRGISVFDLGNEDPNIWKVLASN